MLLAGGRGARLGGGVPKQFRPLAGRPLLIHGFIRLLRLPHVREIVLVLPGGEAPPEVEAALGELAASDPSRRFGRAAAGERRQDSVAAGLRALSAGCEVAVVHDAARPFAPVEATQRSIEAAAAHGGAILAVPAHDTVKLAAEDGRIERTLDRNRVWLAQTPQAFRGDLIEDVAARCESETTYTDEASILEAMGLEVVLIEGSAENFKVTTQADFARAEAAIRRASPQAPGIDPISI